MLLGQFKLCCHSERRGFCLRGIRGMLGGSTRPNCIDCCVQVSVHLFYMPASAIMLNIDREQAEGAPGAGSGVNDGRETSMNEVQLFVEA